MKRYCIDTSAFSNPLMAMPQDIHVKFWQSIMAKIEMGKLAVTFEIYDELTHLEGEMNDCILGNKDVLLLEVGQAGWNWQDYLNNSTALNLKYKDFISENLNNIKGTVGIVDMSIIALAQTLDLPLVSMEKETNLQSDKRRHIPDICKLEGIKHIDFNDFLRLEGIKN